MTARCWQGPPRRHLQVAFHDLHAVFDDRHPHDGVLVQDGVLGVVLVDEVPQAFVHELARVPWACLWSRS